MLLCYAETEYRPEGARRLGRRQFPEIRQRNEMVRVYKIN